MFEEIIEYLGSAPCLALVGSGLSAECGLPTWAEFAEQVFERANSLDLSDPESKPIEDAFARGNFPGMFGAIATSKRLGKDWLHQNCRELLKTPDKRGRGYTALVRLPFRAYLTTNFDDLLRAHLERAGTVAIPLGNTSTDLAKMDLDALQGYVVKLHGDFEGGSSLILTESEYDAVNFDPKFQYLRTFIQSYFLTRHVIILGYSVSDPDIQAILKQNRLLLKRTTSIYAFVANATPPQIDEWDLKYNIRIIPYRATRADHRELFHMLVTLGSYVGDQPTPPRQRLDVDLKVAQSLYMWHKFQAQPRHDLRMDALKALLLSIAVQVMSADQLVTRQTLKAELNVLVGLSEADFEASLRDSLQVLCDDGLLKVAKADQQFEVSGKTIELVAQFRDQYVVLSDAFKRQTKIDFRAQDPGLNEVQLSNVADVLVETVTAMFSERGIEIVNMVFAGQQARLAGAAALFRMIFSGARRLQPAGIQHAFVQYATKLLSDPSGNQERFLEYLSKAFVCVHALAMDPDGKRFQADFLSNRTLIVDDNVLIPLLAVGGSKSMVFDGLLRTAIEHGLRLAADAYAIDTVYDHLTWAEGFVAARRDSPTDVLRAVLGHGSYRKNAFLDGWIRRSAEQGEMPFTKYLNDSLGERHKRGYIEDKLRDLYGVQILDFASLGVKNREAYVIREDVEGFIAQRAQESGLAKSAERIKAEAETYTYLYLWQELAPKDPASADWKSSFLSQGGFLNRVAIEGPHPLGRPVTVSPDALYEFLVRLGQSPTKFASFAEVLHSSYLYSADYFVDRKKYAKFFGGLINEAERIYASGLKAYREYIDESLQKEFLFEMEPLERPLAVERLESVLKAGVGELGNKYKELQRKNEELERQLAVEKNKNTRLAGRSERMKDYGERVAKRLSKNPRKRR